MNRTTHDWNDMRVDVWMLNAGEKIPRHRHPFVHTTGVAQGRTEVEVWWPEHESSVFQIQAGGPDYEFPPDIDHEIRAMDDDTIAINMSRIGHAENGADGGIAFDDP